MNSVKATKWLTELNISDKNPFEYNSVTKNFWCKPGKKGISADQKIQLKQQTATSFKFSLSMSREVFLFTKIGDTISLRKILVK